VLADSVLVVLTNPAMPACCGNAMGLDNIVLLR
jgi:elongation factor P--beta-lysine ligase